MNIYLLKTKNGCANSMSGFTLHFSKELLYTLLLIFFCLIRNNDMMYCKYNLINNCRNINI